MTKAEAKREAAIIMIGILRQTGATPDDREFPDRTDREKIDKEISALYRWLETKAGLKRGAK
jgi:hypothetical protein